MGLYKVGKAPLAIMACANVPFFSSTSSPVSIFVATQKKGTGNLLKSFTSLT